MTGWDISPSGVQGVLKKTATAAEGLSNTGKALQKTMPSAAKSAGTIQQGGVERSGVQGPVAAALGEFFTAYQEKLMYVAVRTSNSLSGAAGATNAYVKGDLEMAARAQANALKEPKIDLPGADGGQQGGR
ncbi:hypothetical protein HTV45_09490 [Streptomyces sp. CHD11]|uniref:DUF6507 family protein n=1 Tax=Streptomyces sp. CHD11 TaxID=2741325 RepID=UPI001BFC6600|nr:DUF6507 family protein [Streptomyces sp. CHD11]MBT3151118.1 hypothetical protein [Streptomyces sp. CHD11]